MCIKVQQNTMGQRCDVLDHFNWCELKTISISGVVPSWVCQFSSLGPKLVSLELTFPPDGDMCLGMLLGKPFAELSLPSLECVTVTHSNRVRPVKICRDVVWRFPAMTTLDLKGLYELPCVEASAVQRFRLSVVPNSEIAAYVAEHVSRWHDLTHLMFDCDMADISRTPCPRPTQIADAVRAGALVKLLRIWWTPDKHGDIPNALASTTARQITQIRCAGPLSAIRSLMQAQSQLQTLSIDCTASATCVDQLVQQVPRLKNLITTSPDDLFFKSFAFSGLSLLELIGVSHVCLDTVFLACPALKTLRLHRVALKSWASSTVCTAELLNVSDSGESGAAFSSNMLSLLSAMPKLSVLELASSGLKPEAVDDFLVHLARVMTLNTALLHELREITLVIPGMVDLDAHPSIKRIHRARPDITVVLGLHGSCHVRLR